MKNLKSFLAIMLLVLSTTACSQHHTYNSGNIFGGKTIKASNNYVTKDLKVDNFANVNVAGSIDVTYTQKTGKPQVKIYTSDNIVELLDINVKNNTLYIGFKKNVSVSYEKLEISVSAEKLNAVALAGSGDFTFANGLKTEDLKISVAGSGDIKGDNITCGNLDVSIAGSGDINCSQISCANLKSSIAGSGDLKLNQVTATAANASIAGSGTIIISGSAQEASYSIAGSGDLFAEGLQCKRVTTSISGSGDIKCYATDYLKVRTSGSGSVGYKGEPKELDYPKKGLYKL